MIRIGALWILDRDGMLIIGADEIANKMDSIWVSVSKCSDYWFAATTDIPHPSAGEDMREGARVVLSHNASPPEWEPIRIALIDGRFPAPNEGVDPYARNVVDAEFVTCTCDIRALLAGGCPSTRGEECPDY